jgi:integrase
MASRREGSIEQRGERRHRIRWYVGEDPITRRRRYGSKTIRGTRRDAERALREAQWKKDRGILVSPSRETLGRYLDRWLLIAPNHRRRMSTVSGYGRVFDLYVRPQLGSRRLDALTRLDVQEMVAALHKLGLSGRTLRHAHAALSAALRYAHESEGILAFNPARGVSFPPEEQRRPKNQARALTEREWPRLRREIAGTAHEALWFAWISAGPRPSEILALAWEHIDLDRGRITIARTLPRENPRDEETGGLLFGPTKTRKTRVVPIPPSVVQALQAHRARQAEERLRAGSEYENHGLVFATRQGRPFSQGNLTRRLKQFLRNAEVPVEHVSLYSFRHSFATFSLLHGIHVKVVSERLGHASVKITLDVYASVLQPMDEEATMQIETALFSD